MKKKIQTHPEYTEFAGFYDKLMEAVDYASWYRYIKDTFHFFCQSKEQPKNLSILELGCGTGRISLDFVRAGYQVWHLDRSMAMLRELQRKSPKESRVICADIRNFCLRRQFDFIYAVHDTVNYLLEEEELVQMLRAVRPHLAPGAIFLFDITSEYNILKNFDQQEEEIEWQGNRVLWSNEYDWIQHIVTSKLRFYRVGEGAAASMVTEELHRQKIYSQKRLQELLLSEGWKILGIFGDYTRNRASASSIMINFWTTIEE